MTYFFLSSTILNNISKTVRASANRHGTIYVDLDFSSNDNIANILLHDLGIRFEVYKCVTFIYRKLRELAQKWTYAFYRFSYLPTNGSIAKVVPDDIHLLFNVKKTWNASNSDRASTKIRNVSNSDRASTKTWNVSNSDGASTKMRNDITLSTKNCKRHFCFQKMQMITNLFLQVCLH